MLFERKSSEKDIRSSFERVKKDIFNLGNEIYQLKNEIADIKRIAHSMNEVLDKIRLELLELPTHIPTDKLEKPTISAIPSDNPTVPMEIRGLKDPNFDISSGNRGVPTDRQTNQQTDDYRGFSSFKTPENAQKPLKNQLQDATAIISSLDGVRKEIRLKFKQMTQQEMLVFSTVYQLEEAFPEGVEYKQIAQKLGLSESSIRDYIQKLLGKGIPVDKIKLNNKKILLRVSPELKKIAPLEAIIKLREL